MNFDFCHRLLLRNDVVNERVLSPYKLSSMLEIQEWIAEDGLSEIIDAFLTRGICNPLCDEDGDHAWNHVFQFTGELKTMDE